MLSAPGRSERSRRVAIIRRTGRPALRFDSTGLDAGQVWDQSGSTLRMITEAANSVARVEIDGGVIPWAGTAFLVAPRLAITARYVGGAMAERSAAWLNFSNNPTYEPAHRIAISTVEDVHPHWGFSYLVLGEDAPGVPLPLAPKPDFDEIAGSAIAVIGYSGFDQRNDVQMQEQIFEGQFDIKRVSPGAILKVERPTLDGPLRLLHDASTLGGSAGSPLIDLESGEVLGVHYQGQSGSGNHAFAGWELRGDPQWERLWEGSAPRHTLKPDPVAKPLLISREIFHYDQLKAIKGWLSQARINDESSLKTLFLGLSPELMGQVPSAELIMDRIALALDYLNDRRLIWGGRPPLYYMLNNARERRQFDPDALAEIDAWIATVSG